MRTAYTDTNIQFHIENTTIHVLNIIYERFTRVIPTHSHGHDCYEIHYIPYGYGKVTVDGTLYDIKPGTLYVTGPHVQHSQVPNNDDPMQEYCVYFKLHRHSHDKTPSPIMDAFIAKDFWMGPDHQGMTELMTRLFSELEHHPLGYRKQVELLLSQLVIGIVRNYDTRSTIHTPVAQPGLSDNKSRIIEECFLYEYQTLTLKSLSEKLSLSPRQTQRLLMEYYNKSFQEKKAEARMSAAAILLRDHSKSISSISEALGYSSPEHFSNTFRNYYGISPREYRKQLS